MTDAARKRDLARHTYADEPLSTWEARLAAPGTAEARFRAWEAVRHLAPPIETCQHALKLLEDSEAELRTAAAHWLTLTIRSGQFENVLAPLWDVAKQSLILRLDDADPDVQLEAVTALVEWHADLPRLGEVVCDLIDRAETQPTTLAQLAKVCGRLPQFVERTLPSLEHWLIADSAELREAAAGALCELGEHAAPLEAPLAVALDDEEPLVRELAARALGQLLALSDASRSALSIASQDEDPGVAEAARAALADGRG